MTDFTSIAKAYLKDQVRDHPEIAQADRVVAEDMDGAVAGVLFEGRPTHTELQLIVVVLCNQGKQWRPLRWSGMSIDLGGCLAAPDTDAAVSPLMSASFPLPELAGEGHLAVVRVRDDVTNVEVRNNMDARLAIPTVSGVALFVWLGDRPNLILRDRAGEELLSAPVPIHTV